MDLLHYQVPDKFNPNAFWGELSGSVRHSTSSSKCTHILACSLFARDDNLNVSGLSELYFLSCILDGDQLVPGSFLARQLHSAAVSTKGRIVIDGIVTTIARFLGVDPNAEDRVSESEWLDQAAFEIMNFSKAEAGRLCWIYPEDRLVPVFNVDQTTLLHWANLCWVPSDDKVVQPTPHHPAPYSSQARPNSSSQPPPPDYTDL